MDKQLSNELRCHGLLPREDIKTISRRNGGLFARITEPVSGKPPASVLSVMVKQEFENQGIKHLVITVLPCAKGMIQKYVFDSVSAMNEYRLNEKESIIEAAGKLEYLHAKNVLNRDIAVKNCLYGDNKVKISDFGLTREGAVHRMDPLKRVHIRWLAPEALNIAIYTEKTDMFSYGRLYTIAFYL
ncbi:hypothetical protein KIN20_021916 [Parelaphostrongylus tenuis]|uniref:Protein kinase domain-containing protein n=1 Tax=Parelaphostrongylus tenuis TaxID=148309 RepID=A0AAD5QV08_PARTN|nr:hypothetical protein KIN20_004396 [Parelaphostrongylus tenuis]KAJ1362382.1 hypothetical protein KIN20_021916 [Parelaphostrongylus tenuis]